MESKQQLAVAAAALSMVSLLGEAKESSPPPPGTVDHTGKGRPRNTHKQSYLPIAKLRALRKKQRQAKKQSRRKGSK